MVSDDGTQVDAPGEIVVDMARLAKHLDEVLARDATELFPREDTHLVHPNCRLRSYAPKLLYPKTIDKALCLSRMDHEESIGLAIVGGYLGQKLVVAHTSRCRQPRLLGNTLLDLARHIRRQRDPVAVFRHIEESLING